MRFVPRAGRGRLGVTPGAGPTSTAAAPAARRRHLLAGPASSAPRTVGGDGPRRMARNLLRNASVTVRPLGAGAAPPLDPSPDIDPRTDAAPSGRRGLATDVVPSGAAGLGRLRAGGGAGVVALRAGGPAPAPFYDDRVTFRAFPRAPVPMGTAFGLPASEVRCVAGAPARAEVQSFVGARNDYLSKAALQTLEVRFGQIDRATFDRLHATFGGLSRVPYAPARSYDLVDFLPPAVQALVNQDVELPAPKVIPNSAQWLSLFEAPDPTLPDVELSPTTNCHGAAHAIARAYQGVDDTLEVYFGDADPAQWVAADHFSTVHTLDPGHSDGLSQLELQPGDLVQFHRPFGVDTLLHSAVHVGGGVFFEKPNTELEHEDSPYRLGDAEMITRPVADHAGADPRITVLRPRGELPPGREIFGALKEEVAAWEAEHGQPLGADLVTVLLKGRGGGMDGMGVHPISRFGLEIGPDGRGRPSPVAPPRP